MLHQREEGRNPGRRALESHGTGYLDAAEALLRAHPSPLAFHLADAFLGVIANAILENSLADVILS